METHGKLSEHLPNRHRIRNNRTERVKKVVKTENRNELPTEDPEEKYCDVCNISFLRKGVYRFHMAKRHYSKISVEENNLNLPTDDPDEKYCDVCEKYFLRRSVYRFHMAKYHYKTWDKNKCDVCGEGFYR